MALENRTGTSMATGTFSSMTAGNWRTYITEWATYWGELGINRTADTGQFDPATVAQPGSSVYEVRVIAGIGDQPAIYWKITFSSSYISHSFGYGSDGAGALSGNVVTTYIPWTAGLGGVDSCRFVADGGAYCAYFYPGGGSNNDHGFAFTRALDGDGFATLVWGGGNWSATSQKYNAVERETASGGGNLEIGLIALFPSDTAASPSDELYFFKHILVTDTFQVNPGWMSSHSSDFPTRGVVNTLAPGGVDRSWIVAATSHPSLGALHLQWDEV